MATTTQPTLPTGEDEKLLDSIMEDSADTVRVRGRSYKVTWLKRGTIRKLSRIMLEDGNDDKASCQGAAAILLNGFWKILFFYPFLWRWFYYVRQYGDHELLPVIALGKKKIPVEEYLTVIMFLTAMKDTVMNMTKEEAARILREPPTGNRGK